ncbi:MAG: aromatic amino acid transport family protein [Nanoarchaeota archaeon]|nr:aromatic amino acid transport family protein [Nanoarchaeota archaeon]
MDENKKRFWTAVFILVGMCIGAGVLGIPYIAAKSGFLLTAGYIIFLGLIILLVNLYLGEISLRTKQNHQIVGYAGKYLGKRGKKVLQAVMVFEVYSAVLAYLIGVSESFNFLFFNADYIIYIGLVFGIFMSMLIWRGIRELKRLEKIGVGIIFILLFLIVVFFAKEISFSNLQTFNLGNIFLPFGVILFALLAFQAIPQVRIVLHKKERMMKKVLITGTLISIVFYILFVFVVVGFKGGETPEIATFALGSIFVWLGVFTMFTSYLALGNALFENLMFDQGMKKRNAWFLSSVIPIILFLTVRFFDIFSFVEVLAIGGLISGVVMSVMILIIAKKAKRKGDRKPEYTIPINWIVVGVLSLIFILGLLKEIF